MAHCPNEPWAWADLSLRDFDSEEERGDFERVEELEREGFGVVNYGKNENELTVVSPGIGIVSLSQIKRYLSRRRLKIHSNFCKWLMKTGEYIALTEKYEVPFKNRAT